jgi:uncharacterized protein YceH (UPF0502 family)
MELTPQEIRVLGCLAEKEATTPDTYPLSTNGLLLACNQRSSRDPVVHYDEDEVTRTLVSLRERELVRTSREGGRVYKHAHLLRQALDLDGAELAVLSVLFLRGPQTPGELRTRSERQHGFATVDETEAVLERLARRNPALTAQLERRPGQKEPRWAHLLGAAEPPARAVFAQPSSLVLDNTNLAAATGQPPPAAGEEQPAARHEIAGLRDQIAALRADLADLRTRVETLERPP